MRFGLSETVAEDGIQYLGRWGDSNNRLDAAGDRALYCRRPKLGQRRTGRARHGGDTEEEGELEELKAGRGEDEIRNF